MSSTRWVPRTSVPPQPRHGWRSGRISTERRPHDRTTAQARSASALVELGVVKGALLEATALPSGMKTVGAVASSAASKRQTSAALDSFRGGNQDGPLSSPSGMAASVPSRPEVPA